MAKNTREEDKKKTAGGDLSRKKENKKVTPKLNNLFKPEDMSLEEWQVALRQQQAEKESFVICQEDDWSESGAYKVRNDVTRQEYKVVYRGKNSPWNYCSCYDFKTSQLGTCKHIEGVKKWIKRKHKKVCREIPAYTSVYVDYKGGRMVRIRIGEDHEREFESLAAKYFNADYSIKEESYACFDAFLAKAKAIDGNFRCYDDALEYVIEQREKVVRQELLNTKYSDEHLDELLSVKLYPYQKEGVRFAIQVGKAIVADEMGLGKTLQAIASAEIYLREGLADSVLIVCPTSLKYQWKREIERFTGGDTLECEEKYTEEGRVCPKVIVIEGNPAKREQLYNARAPYKIVSYHAMSNDVRLRNGLKTDVLIMDEIQRMKNWDTIIAKAARKIESRYAVLLSGTPLENKIEELYSTMELADQFCLGPYYKFRNDHIVLSETGAIAGYKNLNAVGEKVKSRLIRRTKKEVQLQLPKRNDQFLLVPMTQEQADIHAEFRSDLSRILQKYQKYHFMSEKDRKRMMLLLAQMRMVSDSTFILDQDPKRHYDMKVAEVMNLLNNILDNEEEKVVIFSEWERMTRLVAKELDSRGIRYEYLHGGVPSKQRGQLVQNFTTLPESRVFLSTDAGSTGLNLQVASTLINLDLPWNPAVLEQRIARIYRIGQANPVQILNLVSMNSIEEGMIGKLRFKSSMFEGVLDGGADTIFVGEDKFKKFMDDLNAVMMETPEPENIVDVNVTEEDNVSSDKEDKQEGSICHQDCSENQTEHTSAISDNEEDGEKHHEKTAPLQEPKQLINQGISFFNGLAETLKSPEATRQLVDSIVEVDETTGETNVKIPVANKESVASILQLFGKLLGGVE